MAQSNTSTKEQEFNTSSTPYFMPSDEPELERLNKQHASLVIGIGGLVICPETVDACLVPNEEMPPRILDLGYGSGIWANQMAVQYPHASVLGLDLVVPSSTQAPPNVQFEICDINQGLSKYYGSFNVVHARLISTGIKDYRLMVEEAEKCLLPGGVIILVELDPMFAGEDQIHCHPMAESIKGEGGKGSWFVRCAHEFINAPVRQSDMLGMGKCHDDGLWEHELLDPETAHTAGIFLPIGLWALGPDEETTQKLQLTGSFMREDFKSMFNTLITVFIRLGVPQEVLDEWRPKVEAELETTALHMWFRTRMAWARRRAAPGEAAPPLPILPSGTCPRGQNDLVQRYMSQLLPLGGPAASTKRLEKVEWIHRYRTQEESLRAAKIRGESLGPLPVPWVLRKEKS